MRLITALVVLFSVSLSQAQIIFAPAVTYTTTKVRDNSAGATSVDSKTSVYDLKLAYLHASGLYLGGMYSITSAGDDDAFAAGPTLGYSHYSGFYALFTYHLMSQYKFADGSKFNDGMGAQIDLGWVFPLTSMFSMGPQISYRSINYKKAESAGGTETTIDQTVSTLSPFISLWFQF